MYDVGIVQWVLLDWIGSGQSKFYTAAGPYSYIIFDCYAVSVSLIIAFVDVNKTYLILSYLIQWFRGTVVERWSLTSELSLSCARPTADRWPPIVVEIFIHGAAKATVTNAPQSQLNKWVFSSFSNWPTVVLDWRSETEAGRLFQRLGPATWKARSPKPVWVHGTTQVEISDERSRRRPTSETSWQSSDK